MATVSTPAGLSVQEVAELQIILDPVQWADVYLNWKPYDYQPDLMYGFRDNKKIVLRLGRRLGKCLPEWVTILDPETGDRVTVGELFKRGKANVATMTEDYKITKTSTNIIFDNGVKEVFKVKLKSGREIDATGNHPLYTVSGWKEISELKVGDSVAIPRALPFFGDEVIPDYKVLLLAYIIGDGNCLNGNLRFSNINAKLLTELETVVKCFGDYTLKHYESDSPCDYHLVKTKGNIKGNRINKIREFLKEVGLWDKKADNKVIPDQIMRLRRRQIALFLSRLFATDGWASVGAKIPKGHKHYRVEVGYCSKSEQLVRDIQHLLLRFGIQADIKQKKPSLAWQLTIHRKDALELFAKEIGIYGKENALNKVLEVLKTVNEQDDNIPVEIMNEVEQKRIEKSIRPSDMIKALGNENTRYRRQYAPRRSTLIHFGKVLQEQRFIDLGTSDLFWDPIVSIESLGYHQTYDLTVPETHNFVANDIITHNTEVMCVMTLWYAFTQFNRSTTLRPDEDKYRILIICPFEEQVDLIFDRLNQLLDSSPLGASVSRRVHHRIEFYNGSVIKGMTAGSKSNTGAAGTRGQFADVLIMDEVDYMADADITNIINIANEDPGRIKIFAASTPTGKRGSFYRWCTGKVRGWKHFHLPSTVNKRLLEINPDTGQTYLDDLKEELTDLRFLQEVMAEFGEEQAGVYQKRFIDLALKLGKMFNIQYYDERKLPPPPAGPRILGVDWDKVQATPNLVGMEFDTTLGMFKIIYRKEIPRHKFTLSIAVDQIIASDKLFRWDWIFVDRGMGEMQVEQLHLYGVKSGNRNFANKVIGVSFSEKVKVRDPYTKKLVKKPVKPFMVNYSVNQFEKQHVAIPWDRKLIDQLEGYYIKSVSPQGMPTYTDENEHIIDAMNLCFLGYALKYDSMIKQKAGWGFAKVDYLDRREGDIRDRTTKLEQGYKEQESPYYTDPTREVEILKRLKARSIKGRGGWSRFPSRSNLR